MSEYSKDFNFNQNFDDDDPADAADLGKKSFMEGIVKSSSNVSGNNSPRSRKLSLASSLSNSTRSKATMQSRMRPI